MREKPHQTQGPASLGKLFGAQWPERSCHTFALFHNQTKSTKPHRLLWISVENRHHIWACCSNPLTRKSIILPFVSGETKDEMILQQSQAVIKKKKRKTALLLDCYDSADLRVFELLKGLWQKEMLCIAPDKPRLENYCTDA